MFAAHRFSKGYILTLYIDDNLMTGMFSTPLREGWMETEVAYEVVPNLTADQVGRGDVALISVAESATLVDTHYIDPAIAVVSGDPPASTIAMRTPVRPDGIEESPIRMIDTSPTAELLIRALLRPFFGITAQDFVFDADDPAAADAQCVVIEGLLALTEPELGHQEDLVKAWFVLTGTSVVHAVTVVGVEADGGEAELGLLRSALDLGLDRKRDVRRILAGEDESIDREQFGIITNSLKYQLNAADAQSASNLLARGTWGTSWKRQLPAVK